MVPQTRVGELALSRLMLGTVQFGMPYGVANTTGQPPYETAREMLRVAYDGGVNCLDTAASYGESEAVIGRALDELGLADRVTVVTKVNHGITEEMTAAQIARFYEDSIVNSLWLLRRQTLPFALIHKGEHFRYIEHLQALQARGLVERIGVSMYFPEIAREALESGVVQALQPPASLLDRRFARAGVFALAQARGAGMFVRSIYLQGLLLMPEETIPAGLEVVRPVRRALAALAREAGLSMAEMAARYMLGVDGLSCAVVGVETVEQVRENLAIFSQGPLPSDLMAAIDAAVPELPEYVFLPYLWESLAKA